MSEIGLEQVARDEWVLWTPKERVTVRKERWGKARLPRFLAYDEAGVLVGSTMSLDSMVRFFEPGGYVGRAAWRREHADV
jgi:hypothetical protein